MVKNKCKLWTKRLKSKGVHLTCSLNIDLKPLVDREI